MELDSFELGGHDFDTLAVLPELPTVGEFVPGYAAVAYNGLGAPKGTPTDIIDKLGKQIDAALDDPQIRTRLTELGGIPMPTTSHDFGNSSPTKLKSGAR